MRTYIKKLSKLRVFFKTMALEEFTKDRRGEYSDAHHDLFGDNTHIAAYMVRLFRNEHKRVAQTPRFDVLNDICRLLAREDVHSKFRKNGWKKIREEWLTAWDIEG